MAISTSRAKDKAEILIDQSRCSGCGQCVEVCKDFGLQIENGIVAHKADPLFGCIGCGHCMAICPNGAIAVFGRTISADDLFTLPGKEDMPSYWHLLSLLQRRRSIREFIDCPVEDEMIEKILAAARTAPMGLPPSDVNVLVWNGKEKVRAFAHDFCQYMEGMKWLVSDPFLLLMRPFWGKSNDELFRNFIKPLFHVYTSNMRKGINLVNYDAPLSMYFYGSPYTDPADPYIAATYAMLAAESLGLGACMLGAVHPLIQSGGRAEKFRQRHGIRCKSPGGVFLIFGHPQVRYSKGISRSFASVDFA